MTQRNAIVFEKEAFKRMDALMKNKSLHYGKNGFTAESLKEIFGTELNHSKELLTLWLKNHNLESDYKIITI